MKKLFRTIVSIVLSLTFVISYLNINSKDVSADTTYIHSSYFYNIPRSNDDIFLYKPERTGYYLIEGSTYVDAYIKASEDDEMYSYYYDHASAAVFGLEEVVRNAERSTYFFEAGQTYRLNFQPGEQYYVRLADKVLYVETDYDHVNAYLGGQFDLSVRLKSSIGLDNFSDITYEWCDLDEGLNYTGSSVTLTLTDVLDDDYVFHSGTYFEGCDPYDGDFNTGWVNCDISATYCGETLSFVKQFEVTGFESELSSKCHAREDSGYCVIYHNAYDFGHPIYEVNAYVDDPGIAISYQWYKKDPTKEYTGKFDLDKKYYTILNGYNTNEISMSEAFLQAIGEPYVNAADDNCINLQTDLVCAVTFTQGNKTYVKVLDHSLYYMLQVSTECNSVVTAKSGDTVTLPKDGKFFGEDGAFITTDMPENFEYKFTWYKLSSKPSKDYLISMGESVDIADYFSDYERLGEGKQLAINTSNLNVIDTEFGKVSYVLCSIEPYYNGSKAFSEYFEYGFMVFEIHYCDIKINMQPFHYGGAIGTTAKYFVDADGEGLKYQWQLKIDDSWVNLTLQSAKTPHLSFMIDESKADTYYRCILTDKNGSSVQTNEVGLFITDPVVEIVNQPTDYVGLEGSTAIFHVDAEGDGLSYQWQLKKGKSWADQNSGGAKTDTFSVKADASRNGKVYRCLITDKYGNSEVTNEVSITIKEPSINISQQPTDLTAVVGSTAKFTVAAEGEGLTYQWQLKKGSSWANQNSGGATTPTFSVKAEESRNGKVYRCLITAADGEQIATNPVTLTVKEPSITITQQPVDVTALVGTTAKFTVAAEGEGLTYQWQLKKGNSWANQNSGGATTATFSVKSELSRNGKTYRCLITNADGEQIASNSVTLTVKEPSNAINITVQPKDCTALVGSKAEFKVEAEGEGLTYQWQLKKGSTWANQNSGGATTDTFTVKADKSRNGKVYRCLITDANGEQIATDEVTLTVNTSGEITLPFVPATQAAEPAVEEPATVTQSNPADVSEPAAEEPAVEEPAAAPSVEAPSVPEPAPDTPADEPVTDEAV